MDRFVKFLGPEQGDVRVNEGKRVVRGFRGLTFDREEVQSRNEPRAVGARFAMDQEGIATRFEEFNDREEFASTWSARRVHGDVVICDSGFSSGFDLGFVPPIGFGPAAKIEHRSERVAVDQSVEVSLGLRGTINLAGIDHAEIVPKERSFEPNDRYGER